MGATISGGPLVTKVFMKEVGFKVNLIAPSSLPSTRAENLKVSFRAKASPKALLSFSFLVETCLPYLLLCFLWVTECRLKDSVSSK